MRSRDARQPPDRGAQPRCSALHGVLAALLVLASPVRADDDPMRFLDALQQYHAGNYPAAFATFERLAVEGDSRAQVLLGTALVDGVLLPRDKVRGAAWLRVAAGSSNSVRHTRDRAFAKLLEYEPRLTGAELIEADRIAGAYFEGRRKRREALVAAANARLRDSGVIAAGQSVKPGCAIDPSLPRCGDARPHLRGRDDVCEPPVDKAIGEEARPRPRIRDWPRYPEPARRFAWEGTVVVVAHVDGSGFVCRATVADGSGIQSLDTAALEAVRRWQLAPMARDGRPVSWLYEVNVNFSLSDFNLK